MERNFQKKRRNTARRRKKPVMVITAEGKNKTEQLYFSSFQSQHGKYTLKFVKTGDTDPEGMLKSIEKYWKEKELSGEKYGDKAYIVLDLDCDVEKAKKIVLLSERTKHIRFVVSNPCIEVWFLLHFGYSTHEFLDSKEPKKEIRRYIEGYEECMDVSEILKPRLAQAIKNAQRLSAYHRKVSADVMQLPITYNPMTDIPVIIEELDILQ